MLAATIPTAPTSDAPPTLRFVEPNAPPPAEDLDAAALLAFAKRLTRSRRAPVDLAALPAVWRVSEEDAAALLAALVAVGLATVWARPGAKPNVIITGYAAGLLGLELCDRINTRDPTSLRWVPAGEGVDPGPPLDDREPWSETDVFDPDSDLRIATLADPAAVDPALAAADRDELEHPSTAVRAAQRYASQGRVPLPVLLRGLRPTWPASNKPGEACAGCGGGPLHILEACLLCDRSGNQHLLPAVHPSERPRPAPAPAEPALSGGRGKSKGKPSKVHPPAKRKTSRR